MLSGTGISVDRCRSRTAVITGRGVRVVALFPLGSRSTPLREAVSELVADDEARVIVRIGIMSGVFVIAETLYRIIS